MAGVCESAAGGDSKEERLNVEHSTFNGFGTGGLLTMFCVSGCGTLAGSAHQEAFNQVAKADSVMVSEALRRDFDRPLLDAAFPGWPVEAGFELGMEEVGGMAGVASVAE